MEKVLKLTADVHAALFEGKVSCAPAGAVEETPGHPCLDHASENDRILALYPRPRCSDVKRARHTRSLATKSALVLQQFKS